MSEGGLSQGEEAGPDYGLSSGDRRLVGNGSGLGGESSNLVLCGFGLITDPLGASAV